MSGIAGIFNLDGRPADASLLRRMVDAIAHRGPDGSGVWIAGSVGLGHRMLRTTPESAVEKQPLTDESATLSLTFDGRVDNREEISSLLSSHGWKLRDQTDAEIILRAYQCWGEECAGKIVGDFAFVVWDGKKQQLFCVRDVVGLRLSTTITTPVDSSSLPSFIRFSSPQTSRVSRTKELLPSIWPAFQAACAIRCTAMFSSFLARIG